MWTEWAEASAAAVLEERQHELEAAARAFSGMRREMYMYTAEAAAARRPGRRLLERFHRAWAKLRRGLSLPPAQGGYGIYLSRPQERLWEAIRDATLLKMYGGKIADYLVDIRVVRKMCPTAQELHTNVAIVLGRRFGKTFVEQTVIITAMVTFPTPSSLQVYNMTWPQAKTYLTDSERMLNLLKDDPECGWKKDRDASVGGRKLAIKRNSDGAKTSLSVFGNAMNKANAQNLRGTGGGAVLVILDEGLFFCDAAYEVILPTIANGAGFVITSSQPPLGTNAVGLLTATMPDTGTPVMRVLNWTPMCLGCKAKQTLQQREIVCRHEGARDEHHFRSRTDALTLKAFMSAFGGDAHAREMLNLASGDTSRPYFREAAIAATFDARHMVDRIGTPINWFIVSVDPGSKGGPSDTAVVTFTCTPTLPGRPPRVSEPAGSASTRDPLRSGPLSGYLLVRFILFRPAAQWPVQSSRESERAE